jgi:serine/threonine protein kinase
MKSSDYLILDTLSSNNVRVIYKVKDKKNKDIIVLKKVRKDMCEDYEKEILCISEIELEYIIKHVSHFEENNFLYMLFELAKKTVGQILQSFKKMSLFFLEEVC